MKARLHWVGGRNYVAPSTRQINVEKMEGGVGDVLIRYVFRHTTSVDKKTGTEDARDVMPVDKNANVSVCGERDAFQRIYFTDNIPKSRSQCQRSQFFKCAYSCSAFALVLPVAQLHHVGAAPAGT